MAAPSLTPIPAMKATVVVARGKETIHSMFGTVRLEHDGSAKWIRIEDKHNNESAFMLLEQVRLRSTSSKKLSYSPHSNADLTVSFSFSTEDAAAIVLSSIRGEVLQQVSCLDESWESLLRTDEASVALRRAPPIKKPAVAQPIHSRGREQVAATAPSPVRLSSSTTSSGQQDLGFAPNNTGSSSVQASILEALSAKAGALLQTLDRLKQRSCLSDLKLVFPQIVVLGEESSGKSSVLERLSMCEFFPRGEGICTRMPIEFEMIHKSEQEMHDFCTARKVPFVSNDCHCLVSSKRRTGTVHEYGLFGATTVRDHVKAIMDHEVKCNNGDVRGVTDQVLNIAIIGQQVLDLKLLDLPGIVQGRGRGEPEDMNERTTALAVKYIDSPHSLVWLGVTAIYWTYYSCRPADHLAVVIKFLLVVPSYQQINCSPAGLLVQQYGKESMTLGVLTKADKYTVAKAFPLEQLHRKLAGTSEDCIRLPHGYVAVANRDTSGPTVPSLAESAAAEEAVFSAMPATLRDRCGYAALTTRVVDLLCDYTSKTSVPQAVQEIDNQIFSQQRLLESLGMAPTDTRLPQAALDVALQLLARAISRTEAGACPWPPVPRLESEAANDSTMPTIAATRIWNANKIAAEQWLRDCLVRSNSTISSAVVAELRNHRALPTALHRFHKLRTEIGTMLQRSVDRSHARVCSHDNVRRRFETMTSALEATNQEITLERAVSKLARMLQNEATIDAIDQFRSDLSQALSVDGIFLEDTATSQKRRELTQLIAELTAVRGLVQSLSMNGVTVDHSCGDEQPSEDLNELDQTLVKPAAIDSTNLLLSSRSRLAHLDQGSISMIASFEDAGRPFVQIISIRRLDSGTDGAQERYRLVISDGIHYQPAILSTQLNHLIKEQQIVVRCIVRLNDYICNAVDGRKIATILALNVVEGQVDHTIGSPVSVDQPQQHFAGRPPPPQQPPQQPHEREDHIPSKLTQSWWDSPPTSAFGQVDEPAVILRRPKKKAARK